MNLPKLKTHKKTGVTLALKNLVGINGDKNWLPHHSRRLASAQGGDEFPEQRLDRPAAQPRHRGRAAAAEARRRRAGCSAARGALENAARGDDFIRSGNWYGNRTTWRMCLDLNRCLYYSDARGPAPRCARPRCAPVLTVLDGIVAGEGEGPLAPRDVPLGVVLAGDRPGRARPRRPSD